MKSFTLHDYRRKNSLTLAELANDIGIPPATLHRLEGTQGYQTMRKFNAWCSRNNMNPSDLVPDADS